MWPARCVVILCSNVLSEDSCHLIMSVNTPNLPHCLPEHHAGSYRCFVILYSDVLLEGYGLLIMRAPPPCLHHCQSRTWCGQLGESFSSVLCLLAGDCYRWFLGESVSEKLWCRPGSFSCWIGLVYPQVRPPHNQINLGYRWVLRDAPLWYASPEPLSDLDISWTASKFMFLTCT